MSVVEQFPYCDRNPTAPGLDLMPDLPILLRDQAHVLSAVGLVDSGASISVLPYALGVQLGFDWHSQTAQVTLAGTLAHVQARGVVVEAVVGKLTACAPRVRLGQFGSGAVSARRVQLLPGVRGLLVPRAWVFRACKAIGLANSPLTRFVEGSARGCPGNAGRRQGVSCKTADPRLLAGCEQVNRPCAAAAYSCGPFFFFAFRLFAPFSATPNYVFFILHSPRATMSPFPDRSTRIRLMLPGRLKKLARKTLSLAASLVAYHHRVVFATS